MFVSYKIADGLASAKKTKAPCVRTHVLAMAIESAPASPVIVMPAPAVKVSVSVGPSATGFVPDGTAIVLNASETLPAVGLCCGVMGDEPCVSPGLVSGVVITKPAR
jgi:hypothetical protein